MGNLVRECERVGLKPYKFAVFFFFFGFMRQHFLNVRTFNFFPAHICVVLRLICLLFLSIAASYAYIGTKDVGYPPLLPATTPHRPTWRFACSSFVSQQLRPKFFSFSTQQSKYSLFCVCFIPIWPNQMHIPPHVNQCALITDKYQKPKKTLAELYGIQHKRVAGVDGSKRICWIFHLNRQIHHANARHTAQLLPHTLAYKLV